MYFDKNSGTTQEIVEKLSIRVYNDTKYRNIDLIFSTGNRPCNTHLSRKEYMKMKLNAPKQITFIICVALIVVGVILNLAKIGFGFWLLLIGAVVLALSCVLAGL